MTKIRIELECNDDAAAFFNELMEDARDLVKGDEDKLEQYDSVQYEITIKPHIYADHLGKILDTRDTFAAYVKEQGTHIDNTSVDLIGAVYDLDADELTDNELLQNIALILQYAKELKEDPALNCECGYGH